VLPLMPTDFPSPMIVIKKIITEQPMVFSARVCALFKDENALERFVLKTTGNKKKIKTCFLTVPLRRGCPPCTLLDTTAL